MSDLGPDVPLPVSAFIRQAVGEGLGVTAARNLMRSEGIGAMSNATFGQLYAQIRAAVGDRDVIAALDYNVLPTPDVYSTYSMGPGGQYASFVETFIRPIGEREVTSRWYTYVTDGPHSPQAAVDAAMIAMDVEAGSGFTPYGDVVVGSVVSSMARTEPRLSA